MVLSKEDLAEIEAEEAREEQAVKDYLKKEKEEDKKRELELKRKEIVNAKASAVRETERMKEKLSEIEELSKKKNNESGNMGRYLFIAIGFVFIVVSVVLIIMLLPSGEPERILTVMSTCGDGTFYERCSLSKPYYCAEGELVVNAILCGCPDNLRKIDGECVSKYSREPKEINLKYNLRGEEKAITLTVYLGVQKYLSNLSRSLLYRKGEMPRRDDFKLMKIEDELQRELLLPLVVKIQNEAKDSLEDQLRIAISLVQNIPYGESEFSGDKLYEGLRLSRYPYQVLLEGKGSCEGKSELLTLILREFGYGSAMFYYKNENHEAVGIKCSKEYSLGGSGYCFVETTVPALISYSTGNYLGIVGGRLLSSPQIILLNKGRELADSMYEFKDADRFHEILNDNAISFFERNDFDKINHKYGLGYNIK